VEEAEREAHRVVTLASTEARIPFSGAVTLLRDDPKTQGPILFARYCASCHTHEPPQTATAGGVPPSDEATGKTATAPNLYGFANRNWIAGLLDPQKIAGHEYFGGTSHREGEMVGYVTETVKDWSKEEVRDVTAALSAEAQLPAQVEADKKDATQIESGRKLIATEDRCVSCHKFRESGELGSAPDLSGYGSREWLIGMISDPKQERFYRDDNDRMPSFAEHPHEASGNLLNPQKLGLIVDWLRGQWYEPPAHPADSNGP
jgi:ubiquinol-cytochrome c reductase cytochrome b subunit